MSNLTTLRPYPSSFPSVPPPPTLMTSAFEVLPPSPTSSPSFSSSSYWRENRNGSEVSWVASTPSQSSRNSIVHPPPSPAGVSLSALSLATSQHTEPETKRRRIDIETLTHPSSPPSSSSFLWESDVIASSALALHSLALDPRPFSYSSSISDSNPPSLSSSPSSSPPTTPTSLSSSSSSYTRDSESPFDPPSPPSSSPPLSPRRAQSAVEILRHKGKQLKSRCTCCHVCRTSLKNYPRNHLDCSACNAVVCQNCIEFRYP